MAADRLKIIDCDIHPSLHSRDDLNAFLPKRWQEHLKTFGPHIRNPFTSTTPYPRSSPLISRRDAWPPTGGPPGSDLAFMQKQHLDPFDVEFGLLQVLDLGIPSQVNLEFGAALQYAINEWQIEFFSKPDPRLKASIVVGQEDRGRGRRRDRTLRGARTARAGQHLAARQRTARTAQILADLRRRRSSRPAARHPCRRLWRPCADRQRLAVILQRGASLERADDGGAAFKPRHRGRAGAIPETEVRLHRRRLRLGAGASPGAWTSISSASAARSRT